MLGVQGRVRRRVRRKQFGNCHLDRKAKERKKKKEEKAVHFRVQFLNLNMNMHTFFAIHAFRLSPSSGKHVDKTLRCGKSTSTNTASCLTIQLNRAIQSSISAAQDLALGPNPSHHAPHHPFAHPTGL